MSDVNPDQARSTMQKILGDFKVNGRVSSSDALPEVTPVETLLGVILGQPTSFFFSPESGVAVAICPIPLIALDSMFPSSVGYVVEIISPDLSMSPQEAATYVAAALDATDTGVVKAVATNPGIDGLGFQIVIDKAAERRTDHKVFRATVMVEVTEDVIAKVISLMSMQLDAYKRITEGN